MTPPTTDTDTGTDTDLAIAALVRAASIVVAASIESLSALSTTITESQLRLLLAVRDHVHANLTTIAAELGVHLSSASRACDALVTAELLTRRDDPASRRNLSLALTDTGDAVLNTVLDYRRDLLAGILARIPTTQRAHLSGPLNAFANAATDLAATSDIWTLQRGWTRASTPRL